MNQIFTHTFILALLIIGTSCGTNQKISSKSPVQQGIEQGKLSPENWGPGELEKYLNMDDRSFPDNPMATGRQGAITNTYHAAASRAGFEALKQGGSSVDAAMTTALAQITLNAGSVVSFFGIMNMVHYDAASGKTYSMDATWNTVKNDTEPLTIPAGNIMEGAKGMLKPREISGRSALVGGFMKGLESAHQKFGKLPFEALFEPSIYLAEKGFKLSKATAAFFDQRDKQIRRLAETKATLVKPDGSAYQAGDLFKQTALANTLRKIAEHGSDYMYSGAWAKKAIEAIQADGGKMTEQDLLDYEVIWNEPIKAQYGAYEIAVLGPPVVGSVNLIEALNLAYIAEIPQLGHWAKNGESLRRISDITNMSNLSYLPDGVKIMLYPNLDVSNTSRLNPETSEELWKRMESGIKIMKYAKKKPKHSDTVVAIDKWGNMTALTHSINCVVWGNEAIMVDGVSIGDPASFQQGQIAQAGPGNRLPSPIEVGLISKNGKPILPFASMATGLHQQTVQSILNIIAFDMGIKEAVDAPAIFLPSIDLSNPLVPELTVRIMEGSISKAVRMASGLPIQELPASERRYTQGLWVGIYRNPESGELQAVSPPYATGKALAY